MRTQDAGALAALVRRADPADAGAQNNLGVVLLARGHESDAAAAFARALALDPRMTLARRNLEAAGGATRRARRIGELRARARLDGTDVEARRELALLLADVGRMDEARAVFDALCALLPNDPGPRVQRGLVEQRVGDLDAAEHWLREAIALDPAAALPRAHLGEVIYHRGEPARALAMLDEAIALAPDHADAHFVRGFVLGELGRATDAAAATARALALNPALGRAQTNLAAGAEPTTSTTAAPASGTPAAAPATAPNAIETHLALGLALREKGYYEEAAREYRRALARGGDDATIVRALGELHLLDGTADQALPLFTRLVTLAPNDASAWHRLAVAAHLAGAPDDAEAAYRRATSLAAHDDAVRVRVSNDLAVLRAARGATDDALDVLDAALAVDDTLRVARLNRAQLRAASGRSEGAIADYRAVLRTSPTDADAWTGLGVVLAAGGRAAEARAAFARALDADPTRADARYELGFLASATGDHASARRDAEHAMAQAPLVMRRALALALDLGSDAPLAGASPAPDAAVRGFDIAPDSLDSLLGDVLAPSAPATTADVGEAASAYAIAEECLRAGLYERATAAVSGALARGADRATGLELLADAFAAQGFFGEALERYQESRLADPAALGARLGELRMLRETGRRAAASAAAESLVGDHPANAHVLALAALARADAGQLDAAREAVARAEAFASDVSAWTLVADAWRALGERDAEIDACLRGLALAPERWRLRLALARALAAVGRSAEAMQELAPLVDRDVASAEARMELAALRVRTGDRRGAVSLLVDVLADDALHLDALAALGALLLDDGRAADARVAVERVLRFDAQHALAMALDGELLAGAGRVQHARERWRAVIAAEPASEGAARARRALRASGESMPSAEAA